MSWATCCGVSDWGSPWAVNQQKMSHSTYHCSGSKTTPEKNEKSWEPGREVGNMTYTILETRFYLLGGGI